MTGNVPIVFSAFGVFGTGTLCPDVDVAAVMRLLALRAGQTMVLQARQALTGAFTRSR
jgi:hypothetical protein